MAKKQRNVMNLKSISFIILMLICSGIAIADQKVISFEEDFTAGSFSGLQLNRNPANVCDALRYIFSGYDYPTSYAGFCGNCDGLGNLAEYSDDSACGTIDCDGKNYYYTSGSSSATSTNYCKKRDYADITSNRCEGIDDCKDANSGDCTSYSDSTVATCGNCCYASGACSSCSYYSSSTQGQIADYYFTSGSASATGTNYCKKRDYHCTGNSCGQTYSDSTVATCGICQYASGACSSCANYGTGTSCGTNKECSSGSCVTVNPTSCGSLSKYYKCAGTVSFLGNVGSLSQCKELCEKRSGIVCCYAYGSSGYSCGGATTGGRIYDQFTGFKKYAGTCHSN